MKICIVLTLICCLLALSGCPDQDTQTTVTGAVPSTSAEVINLTDSDFEASIAKGVVLVDFWATWCGPCQYQGPIVEAVAQQVQGKATVAKLDVDIASVTAGKYQTTSIPTLIVFKDGSPVKRFVGVTQADKLLAAIEGAL
jgi:thioredoxin 1